MAETATPPTAVQGTPSSANNGTPQPAAGTAAPTPTPVPSTPSATPLEAGLTPSPTTFNWRDHLPEELKNDTVLANVKDVPDMAKQLVDAQRFIGRKRIALPGNDAKPEELAEFNKAIGVPEKPEEYGVKSVKLPEGITIAPESLTAAEKTFHEAGLTPKQVEKIMGFYLKDVEGQFKLQRSTIEAQTATEVAGLKSKWGNNFETNVAVAKLAAERFGGKAMIDKLDLAGRGGAEMVELFHNIGKGMLEDSSLVTGKVTEGGFTGSADQAKYTIAQIKAGSGEYKNFWKEMNDQKNPELRSIRVKEWEQLNKKASVVAKTS